MSQLELPLFDVRSTADNPAPETERTHPAQMIIRHCGKRRNHVSHAFKDGFTFGCPGTPDLRDNDTVVQHARQATERLLAVRDMELLTYDCGVKREHHPPHERGDGNGHCAGLTDRRCADPDMHPHHRWWSIPDAFYWCDGLPGAVYGPLGRAVVDVELP